MDPRFQPWSIEVENTALPTTAQLLGTASLELDVRDANGNAVSLYSVEVARLPEQGRITGSEHVLHGGDEFRFSVAYTSADSDGWLSIGLDSGPLMVRWRMSQLEAPWPPTSEELDLH